MFTISDFQFVEYLDSFVFSGGKFPILITGVHAYSVLHDDNNLENDPISSSKEQSEHLCDYAVHPILSLLSKSNEFFIIENKSSRLHIDMNRPKARYNDEQDANDYVFRQLIRVVCNFIKSNLGIPINVDLHSFPTSHKQWEKYDIVILTQTEKNAKTNRKLLVETKNFFENKNFTIASTPIHNYDDLVIELAEKDLAIPLLIEINEKILLDIDKFYQFVEVFREYLIYINSLSLGKEFSQNSDKNDSNDKISYLKKILDEKQININTSNLEINKILSDMNAVTSEIVGTFESYRKPKKIINSSQDSLLVPDLPNNEPNTDLSKIVPTNNDPYKTRMIDPITLYLNNSDSIGHDGENIVIDMINLISKKTESIIVPIEVLLLYTIITYTFINRNKFQEWDVQEDNLIYSILEERFQSNNNITVPKFQADPSTFTDQIFQSYNFNGAYNLFVIINLDYIDQLPFEALEEDVETISNLLKEDFNIKDITNLSSKIKEKSRLIIN